MSAKRTKAALLRKRKPDVILASDYLSTGSSLLNLACSGQVRGGFVKGKYFLIVGDSTSGKTALSLSCLAEASINRHFDGYDLILDNVEDGAGMVEQFFGKKFASNVQAPAYEKDGTPIYSESVEEFYFHFDDHLNSGRPCIYLLDSTDALTSREERKKFKEHKKAHRAGKESAGDFGMSKAKYHSATLRQMIPKLRKTKSILIVISQTRDSAQAFTGKTRAGGRALKFYAAHEMWTSVEEHIRKEIKGKKRELGIKCHIKITKNRLLGQEHHVTIPIYHSFGIDDLGSCIDYLVEEGHWKKVKGIIAAKEFRKKLHREKLIKYIEDHDAQQDLRLLVSSVWREIQEACKINRKSRYE